MSEGFALLDRCLFVLVIILTTPGFVAGEPVQMETPLEQ